MQTFLPYPSLIKSLRCLDTKRLGKQRVEAFQILRALCGITKGWQNHPATRMWRDYEGALAMYYNQSLFEWERRGFQNNMECIRNIREPLLPPWFGNTDFHAAHRSNLLRKDLEHYSKFCWSEPLDLPYIWPKETRLA